MPQLFLRTYVILVYVFFVASSAFAADPFDFHQTQIFDDLEIGKASVHIDGAMFAHADKHVVGTVKTHVQRKTADVLFPIGQAHLVFKAITDKQIAYQTKLPIHLAVEMTAMDPGISSIDTAVRANATLIIGFRPEGILLPTASVIDANLIEEQVSVVFDYRRKNGKDQAILRSVDMAFLLRTLNAKDD